ncbi:MAG: hypothetical protein ACYS0E_03470, partial [Planctomycetota bacterium]
MTKSPIALAVLLSTFVIAACSSGSTAGSGSFRLIEFLEAGQNNIPRNRQMTFRFSAEVAANQDLSSRLKIQNVIQEDPSNFARARGSYLINAEEVVFTPRLPQLPDRSDAGFKEDASYHVFLSGGTDGLQSVSGDRVPTQQEFVFETNIYFEDIFPAQPPRSVNLMALDRTNDETFDVSRLDPRPAELAKLDNATLIANGRIIDPGAGGPPEYGTPWHFDLRTTEPIDPASVTNRAVEMYEIYSDAMDLQNNQASAGHFGNTVDYRVAVTVEAVQSIDPISGEYDLRIRVTPVQTLVDNTRYRLSISGDILGLDFRKTFKGDNGLTGDGQSIVDGLVYSEPGGLGYVTEFLVADRPFISAQRTLLYDPLEDGIYPETGQSTLDPETGSNTALYNPGARPGSAVGFLSAFGNGTDGPLAITGTQPTIINTGDTFNEPLGKPFVVQDINPDDDYTGDTRPGSAVEWDSAEPFELNLESLTISSSSTLRFEGVNSVMLRVTGITQITGILDLAGENGKKAGGGASGGGAGAGGFDGGYSGPGYGGYCYHNSGSGTCSDFTSYLNSCAAAKSLFPGGFNGEGPGRGHAGGSGWVYYAQDSTTNYCTSGGGGAGHALAGTAGEDRHNTGQAPGTSGKCGSSNWPTKLSSVIGVRSTPGPTYGDREIIVNNLGGSGGAGGGSSFNYYPTGNHSGGGGGGGGGSVQIVSAGDIIIQGGRIDVSGGNGGKGEVRDAYPQFNYGWYNATGGGGGGAGGTLALMSGGNLVMTTATLD